MKKEVQAAVVGGLRALWSSATPADDLALASLLAAKVSDPRAKYFARALDLLLLKEGNQLPSRISLEDADALYASGLTPWELGYRQCEEGSWVR